MRYRARRRLHSPNFLAKRKLARKLISDSHIGKPDLVVEIGPGKGRMTRELLNCAGRVIAIEIDRNLCSLLRQRFKFFKNFEIVNSDFLRFRLPSEPYKVFSNIPFAITSDIVRKLTQDKYLKEAYLVIQKEAAKKFIGMPYAKTNSLISVHLKPWFDISVAWKFKRFDFEPMPRVDCVLVRIKRRDVALIPNLQKRRYERFMKYYYDRNKASRMRFDDLRQVFILWNKPN